jgi:hypothetical protein
VIDLLSQTFVSSGYFRLVQFGARIMVQASRTRGFPFPTRSACAESNARSDHRFPPGSSIPTKGELWFRPRNRGSRSCRANRPPTYIKADGEPYGSVSDPDHGSGLHASPSEIGGLDRRSRDSLRGLRTSRLNRREFGGLESAACGSPPRRAYRPYRSCGRVAEGGGLLNRYRVVKPYRGFESLRLRQQFRLNI